MVEHKIDILCAQETMNLDNGMFARDGYVILTATDLTIEAKHQKQILPNQFIHEQRRLLILNLHIIYGAYKTK